MPRLPLFLGKDNVDVSQESVNQVSVLLVMTIPTLRAL